MFTEYYSGEHTIGDIVGGESGTRGVKENFTQGSVEKTEGPRVLGRPNLGG